MAINYQGFHTVFFATNNLEETIRFYRDLLGFPLYYGIGDPSGNFKLYMFEVNETLSIAFFYWPTVEKIPFKQPGTRVQGPWGFDHLMIGVQSEDDLFLLRDTLMMAGIDVSEVVDHGHIYCIYFHDPNDISLEVSYQVYNPRGFPMMNDPVPDKAAEEGSNPKPEYWYDTIDPTPVGQRKVLPGAGWNLIPAEMKNAKTFVEIPEELED